MIQKYTRLLCVIFVSANFTAFAQFDIVSLTRDFNFAEYHVQDMEGDGDLDVFIGDMWIVNDGNNKFWGPPQPLGHDLFSNDNTTMGDMDNDGDLDIWILSSSILHYFENDGSQNYTRYDLDQGFWPYINQIEVIDIDHDGQLELIYSRSTDLHIMEFNDSLIFGDERVINGIESSFFTTEDVNEDSFPDLISTDDNELYWYESKDSASVFVEHYIGPVSSSFQLNKIAYDDIDGDSINDIVFCTLTGDNFKWAQGTDSATFNPIKSFYGTTNPLELTLVDYDKDGDNDIVALYHNNVRLFKNDGTGTFNSPQILIEHLYGRKFETQDFDGDGHLDILTYLNPESNVTAPIAFRLFSTKDGFESYESLSERFEIPLSVEKYDFDKDGDDDLISVSQRDKRIGFFENNGENAFSGLQILTNTSRGDIFELIDMSGDSLKDFVMRSPTDDKIMWFENFGDGTISETGNFIANENGTIKSAFFGDLDGDDDLDLLIASSNSGHLYWFENLGDFNFAELSTFIWTKPSSTPSQTFTELVDFDFDNDLDIVFAWKSFSGGDNVGWFENDGAGNFSELEYFSTADQPLITFQSGDYDLDDDNDFLITSYDDVIYLMTQDSLGNFQNVIIDENMSFSANNCKMQDMNEDGLADIVCRAADGIFIYLQDSTHSFDLVEEIESEALNVFFEDIDNDSETDIIIRTQYGVDIVFNRALPEILHAGDNTIECEFDSIALQVTVMDTIGLSYEWYKNEVLVNSGDSSILPLNPLNKTDEGLYRCRITNYFGSIWSDAILLEIISATEPVSIIGKDTVEVLLPQTYSSIVGIHYSDYLWESTNGFSNVTTSDSLEMTWQNVGTDTLILSVMDSLGCFAVRTELPIVVVGVLGVENNQEIRAAQFAYPNPFDRGIKIENETANQMVQIFNHLGVQVFQKTLKGQKEIQLPELGTGNYQILLVDLLTGEIKSQQLFKE